MVYSSDPLVKHLWSSDHSCQSGSRISPNGYLYNPIKTSGNIHKDDKEGAKRMKEQVVGGGEDLRGVGGEGNMNRIYYMKFFFS